MCHRFNHQRVRLCTVTQSPYSCAFEKAWPLFLPHKNYRGCFLTLSEWEITLYLIFCPPWNGTNRPHNKSSNTMGLVIRWSYVSDGPTLSWTWGQEHLSRCSQIYAFAAKIVYAYEMTFLYCSLHHQRSEAARLVKGIVGTVWRFWRLGARLNLSTPVSK